MSNFPWPLTLASDNEVKAMSEAGQRQLIADERLDELLRLQQLLTHFVTHNEHSQTKGGQEGSANWSCKLREPWVTKHLLCLVLCIVALLTNSARQKP